MRKDTIARLLASMFVLFVRFVIGLRYRICVKGLDKISSEPLKKSGGIVFLPNHPAEIDPVILEMLLWKKFRPRPLVVEHFYHLKGFHFFMRIVGALPLPTMDVMANKWRGKKVEKQFNHIVDALKKRENFLIYPSGRLKISGLEMIGGASLVHNLLQAVPEANVVLVRTTGLWGSQFSKALTGVSPDFGKVLWECVKILLRNGIFFTPKRKVLVELQWAPPDFPIQGSRLEFNKALENWYNRYPEPGPEPVQLISYAFWKEALPEVVISTGKGMAMEERVVSQKIQEEVFAHLSSVCKRPANQIERKMSFSQDLGMDSLDVAQLYLFLDEKYNVSDLEPGDIQIVEDLLQAAAGYKKEKEEKEDGSFRKGFVWPKEKGRTPPHIGEGKTIQEVFLRRCSLSSSGIACVDQLSGPLTYRKLKLAALILSDKIGSLPEERIGVMLPSTIGAYLVILAILLSRKVPVMLNWTVGVKALDHAADVAELQTVITSSKFLDRLEGGDLGKIEEHLYFLEEIKKTISWKDKLRALFLSCLSVESLLKRRKLNTLSSEESAVILFTSGTETLPKGVPLSHFNLLSNQRAALEVASMRADDILYGVLPPFHSFGFSVTGILPLLAGLKICYAPDPTDSHGMARDIARWKTTLFCCAPSFIRALFRVAKPEQLQSLRLIVSGAEKAPQEVIDYVKQHLSGAEFLEGYGITECSPVVTLTRQGEEHKGVGKPLPGVELRIVDTENMRVLSAGEEGEVFISGPNVFKGYLKNPRNPFATIEGRQWYASGDRGSIDPQGHLILSGRLKRFVKIGAEMVSLGGLEEELLRIAQEKHWAKEQTEGPPLAVCVNETIADKPQIVLFTTFAISQEDVNAALREAGQGRIAKVSEIRQLPQIPLTGTGKTHYRLLEEQLK